MHRPACHECGLPFTTVEIECASCGAWTGMPVLFGNEYRNENLFGAGYGSEGEPILPVFGPVFSESSLNKQFQVEDASREPVTAPHLILNAPTTQANAFSPETVAVSSAQAAPAHAHRIRLVPAAAPSRGKQDPPKQESPSAEMLAPQAILPRVPVFILAKNEAGKGEKRGQFSEIAKSEALKSQTPKSEIPKPDPYAPPVGAKEFSTRKSAMPLTAIAAPKMFYAPVPFPVLRVAVRFPRLAKPRLSVRVIYGWLSSYTEAARSQMPARAPKPLLIEAQCVPKPYVLRPLLPNRAGQTVGSTAGQMGGQTIDSQLTLAQFQRPSPIAKMRQLRPKPAWVWVTVAVATMLGAGVSNLFSIGARPAGRTTKTPVAEQAAVLPAATPANVSPTLSKAIEVTGFRVTQDVSGKSQIQYVMVNHSGAPLSGVTVFVTLRTANAPEGQPPLCQFSFVTPELNAQEAKQMVSPVDGVKKAIVLPDWNDVRSEVQVSE